MVRSRRVAAWLRVGIALVALGCGGKRAAPEPLRVAAASDLQAALPAIVGRFEAARKVEVVVTFGASGQLADQIRQGAPFDVFLAANQRFVKDLADEGLIRPDSVRPYAKGSLVLAVHSASVAEVAGLADLAKAEVKKVALANPATAPYGAAARQALERSGLWESLGPKLVQAETVRQALQFVQTGNAEAGFVGRAIAGVPEVKIVEVDPALYDPIVQALGIVSTTRRGEDAEAFARFLLGDEGRTMLSGYGFQRAEEK
jgi:molybdate transport system substrate-binding protein